MNEMNKAEWVDFALQEVCLMIGLEKGQWLGKVFGFILPMLTNGKSSDSPAKNQVELSLALAACRDIGDHRKKTE